MTLGRMGYRLYYVVPYVNGIAPFGLVDRYNAPATVGDLSVSGRYVSLTLPEGGRFACALKRTPEKMTVNGRPCEFRYSDEGLLEADVFGITDCKIVITLKK